jgi:hypothetical protein
MPDKFPVDDDETPEVETWDEVEDEMDVDLSDDQVPTAVRDSDVYDPTVEQ